MVRLLGFHCHGPGSVPGPGTEILQAAPRSHKKRSGAGLVQICIYRETTM